MEPIYRAVGDRLRAARLSARLSQEVVADRVGLTRASISNIELGRQRFAVHVLCAVAEAVGVKAHEILKGLDAGTPEDDWMARVVGAQP